MSHHFRREMHLRTVSYLENSLKWHVAAIGCGSNPVRSNIACKRPNRAQAAERDTPRTLALIERARAVAATKPSSKLRNRLLKMMSASDRALLQPNLEPVSLER